MKKSLYLFSVLLIVGLSLLCGCNDERVPEPEPEPKPEPDVVSEINPELIFASTSPQTITFTTNKAWSASLSSPSGSISWCKISPLSGDAGTANIVVNATENSSYEDRIAILTIKTGNTTKSVTITQKQKDAILLSKNNYEIPEGGGTFEVEANTNVELVVSIASDVEWIRETTIGSRAMSAKKITFIVDKNDTPDERTAIITFKDKKSTLSSTITVMQERKIITDRTIHVDINGTLSDLLGADFYTVEKLTITGKIDGDDIHTIRSMYQLQYLNIEDVIVIGNGYYSARGYKFPAIDNTISMYMFSDCNLHTLILPNSITKIDSNAIVSCTSLTSVVIPNGVKIIDGGFSYCSSLTSITIPNSVSVITPHAFYGCTQLSNIFVSSDNNVFFSDIDGVLTNKDKTEIIIYPEGKSQQQYTIPNSVTLIGATAFRGNTSLSSVTIPSSVTVIDRYAFSDCTELKSIIIPNSVTLIGAGVFSGCTSLTSITIPNGVTRIYENTFIACTSLTSITIPNSVTIIDNNAFNHCTSLTSITIPNSVTAIRNYAFSHCISLTSITIPNSVKAIGNYAFSDCTELKSITIGSGITEIAPGYYRNAFSNCFNIEEIHIKAIVPPVGDVNPPYKNTVKLYVPKGSKEAYQNDYYWRGYYQYIEEE